jgi:hypothetical protein
MYKLPSLLFHHKLPDGELPDGIDPDIVTDAPPPDPTGTPFNSIAPTTFNEPVINTLCDKVLIYDAVLANDEDITNDAVDACDDDIANNEYDDVITYDADSANEADNALDDDTAKNEYDEVAT